MNGRTENENEKSKCAICYDELNNKLGRKCLTCMDGKYCLSCYEKLNQIYHNEDGTTTKTGILYDWPELEEEE